MRGAGIPEPAQKAAAVEGSGPPERRPADEAAVDVPTPSEEAAGSGLKAGGAAEEHKRGRPRSKLADSAILRAATDLMAERGLGAMSIEEVACRAGVGKATIYRRWPSRGALALDAFLAEFLGQQPLPDTGTLRGDLLTALRAWIRSVTQTSAGPMLSGLIAEAQQDRALAAAWRDRVVEVVRVQHAVMLDRAISRGEIPAEPDQDVVLDPRYRPSCQ